MIGTGNAHRGSSPLNFRAGSTPTVRCIRPIWYASNNTDIEFVHDGEDIRIFRPVSTLRHKGSRPSAEQAHLGAYMQVAQTGRGPCPH